MTKDNSDIQDIDVTDIDWMNLSKENFQQLEKKMQIKLDKVRKEKQQNRARVIGDVIVKIRGNDYTIKKTLLQRLNGMKNQKSKNKVIEEIISTYKPIEKL